MAFYNTFWMKSNNAAELVEIPESPPSTKGFWTRRTGLERSLILGTSFVVTACVLTVALMTSSQTTTSSSEIFNGRLSVYQTVYKGERVEICSTPECVIAASDIIQSLDLSVDPCQDFYQFACGGWKASNPKPEESSRWGQFDVLRKELSSAVSVILEEPIDESNPLPFNQAKDLYKACMDEDHLEEVGLSPLVDLLNQYGGWPIASANWDGSNYDFFTNVASIRSNIASDLIIYLWVFADQKTTDNTAMYLDQTSLGLSRSVLVNPDDYETRIQAYKAYLKTVASLLLEHNGGTINEVELDEDIETVFHFETQLANITSPPEDRRDIERMYNPMTINELTTLTEEKVEWLFLLQTMFSNAEVSPLTGDSRVIVQEVEYFKKLVALIEGTDGKVLANYLGWRLALDFSSETTKAMRDARYQYNTVANGVTAETPRWKQCADKANRQMGMAVGTEYVKRYFSEQAKEEANQMVEDIRVAFEELLDQNLWMDEETKPFAKEKAEAISKFIGYPDWYNTEGELENYYNNLSGVTSDSHFANTLILSKFSSNDELNDYGTPSERNKWLSPPTIVNAFYLGEFNSITFPAGILQPPFYRSNTLQAINYGGIGMVIGHEITHGFDDQGRQNDKDGNAIPWWTNATLEAFKEKAQCIVDQYSNISVSEINHLLPNATLNGINTQGENIADNGGVREALLAYFKYVERHGEEPRLPGLEEYTPNQIFFLSNANIWCENISPEGLLNQVLTDPHAPAEYRVAVPTGNMEEFSEIWGCPSGSPMNPTDKCVVW